jgi:hypothetical protein
MGAVPANCYLQLLQGRLQALEDLSLLAPTHDEYAVLLTSSSILASAMSASLPLPLAIF